MPEGIIPTARTYRTKAVDDMVNHLMREMDASPYQLADEKLVWISGKIRGYIKNGASQSESEELQEFLDSVENMRIQLMEIQKKYKR